MLLHIVLNLSENILRSALNHYIATSLSQSAIHKILRFVFSPHYADEKIMFMLCDIIKHRFNTRAVQSKPHPSQ